MRGRKPTPSHLRLVTGRRGKRGTSRNEPKPAALLPEPPPELSADAREEWDRIGPRLLACGILTMIDRAALAAYCQAYGRWVTAERLLAGMAAADPQTHGLLIVNPASGNQHRNPIVTICDRAMADMVRYAAEFGMTPSGRSRVKAGDTPPDGPESEFFP